jgi:hypothetical protein
VKFSCNDARIEKSCGEKHDKCVCLLPRAVAELRTPATKANMVSICKVTFITMTPWLKNSGPD